MSTSSPALTSENHPKIGTLITLFLAPAFIFANTYTTQSILPVLSQYFQIPAPTAGLSVSLLILSVAIGSLFYGPVSDRVGRKPVMVTASFLVTIPTLLCAVAPNFTILVILRALQGLLLPGLTSVAIPYVNEEFEGKGRGLAMGIYVSGLTLGGLFARLGSAAITSISNWHLALLTFAFPTLLSALSMWRFLPAIKSQSRPVQQHKTPFRFSRNTTAIRQTLQDMRTHFRNRRLVGAFIIGFASLFGFVGIFTYLPYYLTGPLFKLPQIQLGLVYLLWLNGVFSPVAGSIAGRIGSRRAVAVSMSMAGIGLLITLASSLPVVIFGLGILALGMFSTVPAVNLFIGEQATVAKGTAASMYLSLYYFGGSAGGVLPGITLLWAGWPGVVFLCLGMVLIALTSDALLCR